ncbi:MAG TPA: M57 family metalloprotease [Ktedonobacteraceae bacterium]|nr:M57 family metalloprotease [Ktedonobacteraceae bacterium]
MRKFLLPIPHQFGKRHTLLPATASLLSICILFLSSGKVLAYNLEGPKWAGQPAPGHCCAYIYVQRGPATTYDQTAYTNAIAAWNNDDRALIFFASGAGMGYTTDTYNSGTSLDGWTNYGSSNGYFTYANTYLNYYFTGDTKNYPDGRIQGIAVHELGHSVGLAHASGCVIMVAASYTRWYTCGIDTPQTDDENGINALY